jgi:hypothetical protein
VHQLYALSLVMVAVVVEHGMMQPMELMVDQVEVLL